MAYAGCPKYIGYGTNGAESGKNPILADKPIPATGRGRAAKMGVKTEYSSLLLY